MEIYHVSLGKFALHDIELCHFKISDDLEGTITNLENRERIAKHALHNSSFEGFLQARQEKENNRGYLDFG
jgi:hypothetical protein